MVEIEKKSFRDIVMAERLEDKCCCRTCHPEEYKRNPWLRFKKPQNITVEEVRDIIKRPNAFERNVFKFYNEAHHQGACWTKMDKVLVTRSVFQYMSNNEIFIKMRTNEKLCVNHSIQFLFKLRELILLASVM